MLPAFIEKENNHRKMLLKNKKVLHGRRDFDITGL